MKKQITILLAVIVFVVVCVGGLAFYKFWRNNVFYPSGERTFSLARFTFQVPDGWQLLTSGSEKATLLTTKRNTTADIKISLVEDSEDFGSGCRPWGTTSYGSICSGVGTDSVIPIGVSISSINAMQDYAFTADFGRSISDKDCGNCFDQIFDMVKNAKIVRKSDTKITTGGNVDSTASYVHDSEHVYPEKTVVEGTDDYGPFTKTIILPKVKNINNDAIVGKINQILSFKNITSIKDVPDSGYEDFNDDDISGGAWGLTDVDYYINYDENNLLNISVWMEWLGAYPVDVVKDYSINLTSGEAVKLSDIFYQDKIADLLNLLNGMLQANIDEALTYGGDETYSKEDIIMEFDSHKDVYQNYGKFTEADIADFKVDPTGMRFIYDFRFSHATRAFEPDGYIDLDYAQLRDYIRPDGLLGRKILVK